MALKSNLAPFSTRYTIETCQAKLRAADLSFACRNATCKSACKFSGPGILHNTSDNGPVSQISLDGTFGGALFLSTIAIRLYGKQKDRFLHAAPFSTRQLAFHKAIHHANLKFPSLSAEMALSYQLNWVALKLLSHASVCTTVLSYKRMNGTLRQPITRDNFNFDCTANILHLPLKKGFSAASDLN